MPEKTDQNLEPAKPPRWVELVEEAMREARTDEAEKNGKKG